jgi:hypothetical protein
MQEGAVLAMSSGNYVAFTDALETQIHNIPHVRIGGTMLNTWSPEAPEFFLHHNHVDKLWDDWQKKSNAHMNAYSFALNSPMPVAYGATPGQYNNLKATKVMYVRSRASTSGSGHFVFLPCNFLLLQAFAVDLSVLQLAIAKATPTQLRQIPQLPAPILTAAEEKMLVDMKRGGTPQQIQDFVRKLAVAKQASTKANEALKDAGSLRTSFEKPVDKALGFDVAKAVEVLKVPRTNPDQAGGTQPGGGPTGGPVAGGTLTGGTQTACRRGTVYCAPQRRCLPVTQQCVTLQRLT